MRRVDYGVNVKQLWDAITLTFKKTYVTKQLINVVTISPLLDDVWFHNILPFSRYVQWEENILSYKYKSNEFIT